MSRTCESCGAEIGETFEEDTLYLQEGLCLDCNNVEEPTYEPVALDFHDHTHELQDVEEDDDAQEPADGA